MDLPPETIAQLAAIGIDPAGARWKRMLPTTATQIKYIYSSCTCTKVLMRIPQRLMVLPGRRIFIGQCPDCRLITWSEWTAADGIYTGGATEKASPVYGADGSTAGR
jgi:hypothetical protein